MSFKEPLFLLALALVPLGAGLYVLAERRARRGRAAFALPAVAPSVVPRRAGWRRHAPVLGYALAAIALIVALARPQATIAVTVDDATVLLVTDRSGSMEATDVQPSRLAAARQAAAEFLNEVPEDVRVGLIAFNHTVQALRSPTRDHQAVRDALVDIQPAGSTATGDALALALQAARQPARPGAKPPPAAIVLLSDGKSVRGRDPVGVAEQAGEEDIPIYTVALGTPDGTIERPARGGGTRLEPVPPDPETLRRVAEASGGQAFTAADTARLTDVYTRLGEQVATEKQQREITAAFAGGALLALVLAALASLRWFGRVL